MKWNGFFRHHFGWACHARGEQFALEMPLKESANRVFLWKFEKSIWSGEGRMRQLRQTTRANQSWNWWHFATKKWFLMMNIRNIWRKTKQKAIRMSSLVSQSTISIAMRTCNRPNPTYGRQCLAYFSCLVSFFRFCAVFLFPLRSKIIA